ncbi:hypothetical protein MES5069_470008 [Mesorhizobium escarrei]|uniref:Uncharacterized protein n=1 Tax=Mesorhizobium escarrei TaxID=666018 RepID=A0ABN8K7D2_9HYPH|nr:hypothetical protein MES5069_470008 [Mesorhizobium escarrei]
MHVVIARPLHTFARHALERRVAAVVIWRFSDRRPRARYLAVAA